MDSSLYSSSRSTGNDSNGTVDDYYHQQGIFARPECQQRYHYGKSRGKQREKEVELSRSRSRRKVKNSDELVSHYCAISTLGPVMRECKELWWKQSMYTPLASQFLHAPIPRITLSCLDKLLGEAADPCVLRIFKDPQQTSVEGISKRYQGSKSVLSYDLIWSNRSNLERFGHTSLQKYSDEFGAMITNLQYHQVTIESVNVSIFERGDLQPKRQMYHYFGSVPGERKEASACIVQFSPVLVEVKKKIYYGLFIETNAPLKYPKEVKNAVSRAHAVFKYTETAITIFTPCGVILQQNPTSNKIFGLEACENNVFSDFEKDGKPVNRLRALFGDNESQYRDMMETVMENGQIWWSRLKLGRQQLMPELKLGRSLSESSGTVDSIFSSMSGEYYEEVVKGDSSVWYAVQLLKFSDPADGQTAIFCEMKNVHKVVLQEERLREAKKHEHELLQSIIPQNIIEHLLEVNQEKKGALSPRMSGSGESFLGLYDFQMIDDDKVSAMAQHYSQVTVFFADIVGFTNMSSHSTPAEIMIMLNRLFTLFDDICDNHNIYKVETIGDAYMCVAGLNMKSEGSQDRMNMPASNEEDNTSPEYHAKRMLVFAKDVVSNAKTVISPENTPVEVRIGLHTGDVVTGVVGYKMPRFCLFGDTVNVASRMESTGRAGHIHASQATRDLVPHEHWIPTGGVEVKGKGLVPTYLYGGGGVENG
jgi:class 3 adenylate cyclase